MMNFCDGGYGVFAYITEKASKLSDVAGSVEAVEIELKPMCDVFHQSYEHQKGWLSSPRCWKILVAVS